MNMRPVIACKRNQAGFSLIDVLVGVTLALVGIVVIFQVFSVSERTKRTSTSGSDALQNGAASVFQLERSIKGAGYGIFPSTSFAPTIPTDPAGTAPISITAGAANTSDSLVLTYRPSSWQHGAFPPDTLLFPAVIPPALVVETISVATNCNGNGSAKLQLCSSVNGVISDGIVLMKAEYGTDTDGNGVVDTWNQAVPASVLSVLAIRFAALAPVYGESASPYTTSVGVRW
jgi:hypothetical protein